MYLPKNKLLLVCVCLNCIYIRFAASPDVIIREVTTDVEFILLACDGIWDVMSNQEVVDFVRDRLAVGTEPEMVCFVF